jgi:ankyrin repeat protein
MLLQELLRRGASLIVLDNNLQTPLHVATQYKQTDIVRLLLDQGTDVNARELWDYTALHYAVIRNQTTIVELLLRRGADVHAVDGNGHTPLPYAVAQGFQGVGELLLLNTNNSLSMPSNRSALHYPESRNMNTVIECLFRTCSFKLFRDVRFNSAKKNYQSCTKKESAWSKQNNIPRCNVLDLSTLDDSERDKTPRCSKAKSQLSFFRSSYEASV